MGARGAWLFRGASGGKYGEALPRNSCASTFLYYKRCTDSLPPHVPT